MAFTNVSVGCLFARKGNSRRRIIPVAVKKSDLRKGCNQQRIRKNGAFPSGSGMDEDIEELLFADRPLLKRVKGRDILSEQTGNSAVTDQECDSEH